MKGQVVSIKEIIREEIRAKYGHKIKYAKDCQIISDSILENTGRQISVSTLKRFFGIIECPFKPSKYTLDTLAIYLNFKNWEDYANSFDEKRHSYSNLNSWELLKKRAQYLTGCSLETIGSKIETDLTELPPRDFTIRKISSFLDSPKVATAFIAPGGYGKSTSIYQLTEYFFNSKEAKFPNDIVMLLEGGSLISLINKFDEFSWMHNLLDFKPQNSFSNYFRENANEIKGHFVVIIDALNEIFYQTEKLTGFLENLLDIIASYENTSWFKLIVTCQPDNWKILTSIIQKKPSIKKLWFDVSFNALPSETINVPLLSKKELKEILEKKYSEQRYQQLRFHSPETAELITHPYFLNLFLQRDREHTCSDIDLLNEFIADNLQSDPFPEAKLKIIDAILQHSEYGRRKTPVTKDDLPCSEEYAVAYKDLIARNIIYEVTVPSSYLSVTTDVRFSHPILLEFLVANKWLREHKFDLDLIQKIIDYYAENQLLRCSLIRYMVKIAFKERKTDLLKEIYTIFSKVQTNRILINESEADPEILNIINIELRKHKELRDYLIPHFAKTRSGQLFYFETFFDMDSLVLHAGNNVDYYLKNNPSEDAQIYGHFLKLTQYFFIQEEDKFQKEYEWLTSVNNPKRLSPLAAGFYYAAMISANHKVDKLIWKEIIQQSQVYFNTKAQLPYNVPIFEYLVINALNYTDSFNKIKELFNLINQKYLLTPEKSTWHYQLARAFYARALLNTGEAKDALEIFSQTELKSVAVNYKYYVRLRYNLVKAEFLKYEDRIEEALQLLQETKSTARMVRFKYFYNQAGSLEENIKSESLKTNAKRERKNLKAL